MESTRASQLRSQAEERFRRRSAAERELPDHDLQRLVTELQIHQCELEIQNEELIRARSETESLLKRYTDLYDFAPIGYFTLSPDGTIIEANLAGSLLLGLKRSELVGRRFALFLPEACRRDFSEFLARTLSSDRRWGWEGVLLGNADRPHDVQLEALAADDRRSCRIVVLDMSDRKQLEAMAEARRREEHARLVAEEANAAKDRFLAVLSHELRTPLTPVLAAVGLLQRRPDIDPDMLDTLEPARRNLELVARLIDDLLDLTRISRGKVQIDKRPVDLCSIIGMAVEVCRPDIENRELGLTVDLGDSPCTIEADTARIEQVLWNLLKNAVKFTPRGGHVMVVCRREGEEAVVEVSDTGVGIEPEALSRVFDAFEQGERSVTRQFGGLGLGLSISKTLVELHGGTIYAASEGRDRGARFSIRLPLAAVTGGPVARQQHPEAGPDDSAPPVLNILLVEDHRDTAELLEMFLAGEGHQVTRAADVATALDLTARTGFDLLLSDLGLPDGSGIGLIREVRARGNRLPAVAISGYGQEKDLRQSREAGFDEHLVKPINLDRLSETLRRIGSTVTKAPSS